MTTEMPLFKILVREDEMGVTRMLLLLKGTLRVIKHIRYASPGDVVRIAQLRPEGGYLVESNGVDSEEWMVAEEPSRNKQGQWSVRLLPYVKELSSSD